MRKHGFTIIILFLATMALFGVAKGEVAPLSTDKIRSATVIFSRSGLATFTADLRETCASAKIASCTLEKKDGNKWVFARSLPVPDAKTNVTRYTATVDYSSYLSSDTSYRLVVVFEADGEQVSKTSTAITY